LSAEIHPLSLHDALPICVVGDQRCPIVDTWWQTETGGILISPLPGATALKPGSATLPFFGVRPEVVDANGAVLTGACEGNLVIADRKSTRLNSSHDQISY